MVITVANETGNVVKSTLQIHSVELSDMAVYTCEAEDSDGIASTETTLNILGIQHHLATSCKHL